MESNQQWPDEIDEWTHYLHGADGNAVAKDTGSGLQEDCNGWAVRVGRAKPHGEHERNDFVQGQLFYVMDKVPAYPFNCLPLKYVGDAFNGVVLWKRKIPVAPSPLAPQSGPATGSKVGNKGERVYFTMGITAAVSALDATSGKTLVTYQGSEGSEEILVAGGALLALVNKGASELKDYVPKHNVGDQARVRSEFVWDEKPRIVMCYDAETGKKRWEHESPVAPLSPASDGERVYFHDGKAVTAIAIETGKVAWQGPPSARRSSVQFNFGPVGGGGRRGHFCGGDRSMTAYEATTGKTLWTSPHERGGYQSPEDLLVIGGLVWSAPITSTRDSGVWTGRDVKTGETKRSFPPKVNPYWFHHRCHIAKATDRFLLASRTGIEFVDIENSRWDLNHWVRGGCLYGVMPCNGLVYAPPHNCACYPESQTFRAQCPRFFRLRA